MFRRKVEVVAPMPPSEEHRLPELPMPAIYRVNGDHEMHDEILQRHGELCEATRDLNEAGRIYNETGEIGAEWDCAARRFRFAREMYFHVINVAEDRVSWMERMATPPPATLEDVVQELTKLKELVRVLTDRGDTHPIGSYWDYDKKQVIVPDDAEVPETPVPLIPEG